MATDIKVVKTVFVVDTEDVKKATKDYNNLADSIDKTGKELTDTGKKATEGSQKVKDGIDKSKQSVDKFKSSFDGIGSVIAGAFAIGSVVAFGKSVLDATVKNEMLTKSFEVMLKSKAQADILMAQLVQFAKTTPFELTEVAEATKRLLAFGVASSDIEKTLRKLGDVSAGIDAPLGDIAYLFGTIKTQGRAMTMDINQFTNRGIPMWEELAKVTGVSGLALKKYVEEGKVGFKEIEQAFTNLTAEGGKFFGLTQAKSEALGGAITNLGDSWNQFLVKLGNGNSGILKSTVSALTDIVNVMNILTKRNEDYVNEVAQELSMTVIADVEEQYKRYLNAYKDNAKTKKEILELAFNESSEERKKILEDQKAELKEIEKAEIEYNSGSFERTKNRLTLQDVAKQREFETDKILKQAEIKSTELYLKTLSDTLKKKLEDDTKSVEQETEKQRKAREKAIKDALKAQQDAFKLELDLLKREEQRKLQEGKNADNPQSKQLQIEDDYNYKRIQIYSKWDKILTKQDKEAKKDLVVNIDTLAKGISEATNKEYQDLLVKNKEYYEKLNNQAKEEERKLNETIERERNMSQSKLSLEKSAKLKAVYENETLNYKEQQEAKENIDLEYSEKQNQIDIDSLKKKLALDDELSARYSLNSDERLKIEAEIADLELKAQTEKNAKIIKDEEEKDKRIRQIAIDGQKFAKQLIDAYFTYQSQLNTAKIAEYETQKQKELDAVDATENGKAKVYTKAEAQKMAINEKYRQLEANVKRKQFELDKQKALIDIAINTAVGVSKAYAQGGVLGAVTGGIVIAAGAIQTALIESQPTPKFAKGGQIKGRTHAEGGQIIEAERDEWVINANASREFHPLLKAINEGTFTRKDLSPELSNMMFGQKMSNINLNTDSLARELRGMPKNHISLDKDGFKTYLYSENLKQESLNNRYLS